MSQPLLGLAFDDITDPIVKAVGEGAYEIGGGDFRYGQNRVEADVKNLFRPPVPLPDLSDALALFGEYLHWIPLDALRQFRNLLPDVTDADFSDVPTAVATIIRMLTDKPLNQLVLDFLREAITGVWGATDAIVQTFFNNLKNFLGVDFADHLFDLNFARETFFALVIEPLLAGLQAVDQGLRDILTGITDATPGDLDDWIAGLLFGDSPLDALNLFNVIPTDLLSHIPASNIGEYVTNMVTDGDFLDAGALGNIPGWLHSLTGGFGGKGSMSTPATGAVKELFGNLIPVSQGQNLPVSAMAKWTGLAGTGNPIQLALTGYKDGSPTLQTIISSHNTTPPTTDWVTLSGVFPVPADIDAIRTRLVVGSGATAGTVSFSKISVTKTGAMLQRLIQGTNPGEFLPNDIEHLFTGTISNTLEILDRVKQGDFEGLVSTIKGDIQVGFEDVGDRLGSFLDDLSPLNGSNINLGEIAADFVPGLSHIIDGAVENVGNIAASGGVFDINKFNEVLRGQTHALIDAAASVTSLFGRLSNLESKVSALPVAGGGTGSGTAAGGAVGVNDTDTFERVGSNLGAGWIQSYSGGAGTWGTPNGHDATFQGSGTSDRTFLAIRNNSSIPRSQTDFQRVTTELSSKAERYYDALLGTFNFCGRNDVWLRIDDASTSLANITGIRVSYFGDGGLTIHQFVNGVGTLLNGLGTGSITTPGPAANLIGEAGVLVDNAPMQIRARVGARIWLTATSTLTPGSTRRRWGHGGLAEGHLLPLLGQERPGGLHFFNAMDQTL